MNLNTLKMRYNLCKPSYSSCAYWVMNHCSVRKGGTWQAGGQDVSQISMRPKRKWESRQPMLPRWQWVLISSPPKAMACWVTPADHQPFIDWVYQGNEKHSKLHSLNWHAIQNADSYILEDTLSFGDSLLFIGFWPIPFRLSYIWLLTCQSKELDWDPQVFSLSKILPLSLNLLTSYLNRAISLGLSGTWGRFLCNLLNLLSLGFLTCSMENGSVISRSEGEAQKKAHTW